MVKDCVVPKLSGNSATPFLLRLLFEFSHFLGTFFPFYFCFSFYAPLCNSVSKIFLFDTEYVELSATLT
jgi:hypothetical protein